MINHLQSIPKKTKSIHRICLKFVKSTICELIRSQSYVYKRLYNNCEETGFLI